MKKKNNNLCAIDFYNRYLSKTKAIYVGEDFIFGKDQIKVVDFIKKYNIKNIHLIKYINNCSSTIIKDQLSKALIEQANELLYHPYKVTHKVEVGNKKGRLIGYRTINFYFKKDFPIIPNGVYITRTKINNEFYPSITFYGSVKSLDVNKQIHMETHILNFNKNIYFHKVSVYFYKKIADIYKFDSIDALKDAISNYIKLAAEYHFN